MSTQQLVADLHMFAAVLAENGRLNEFENISAKFEELQRAAKGELHAEVTVADVSVLYINNTIMHTRIVCIIAHSGMTRSDSPALLLSSRCL